MKPSGRGLQSRLGLWVVCVVLSGMLPRPCWATKMVFANYMLAFPTYGVAVADFERDITAARALGIDGFVVNTAGWDTAPETYYATRAAALFTAASNISSTFKLFFSLDLCCGLTQTHITTMMTAYRNHGNYFQHAGKPVVTTFIGQSQGETFWTNVLSAIAPVVFVPNFSTTVGSFTDANNPNFNAPSYSQIRADYTTWWKNVVDGLAYFAVGAQPANLASTGEAYAQLMGEEGKLYLASMSPYFWEGRLTGGDPALLLRRFYDYAGGEGIATQWASIITTQQPDWVMVVTWNDFTESYLTPADPNDVTLKAFFYNVGPLLLSHAGYAELHKYFIQWFKTGVPPPITTDALYVFYRTHPKNASAPSDTQNIVQYDTFDDLYLTTTLVAPATLEVTTGGVLTTTPVGSGLVHTRVPFNTGTQSIRVTRNGVTLCQVTGDPIAASITVYNFTTTSGFNVNAAQTVPSVVLRLVR